VSAHLSPMARRWRSLRRSSSGQVGMIILAGLLLVAVVGPWLVGDPRTVAGVGTRLQPPGSVVDGQRYLLGTDIEGRDLLARLVHGARYSLLVGLAAVGLALLVGVPLGVLSGYVGGGFDYVMMRLVEMALSLPAILLAIVIVTIVGVGKLSSVVVAVALVAVPPYIRQVRASVLAVKQLDHVTASVALGSSHLRILAGAILPGCVGPIVVLATLGVGTAILDAAGLNFLGLGPEPSTPEWGLMLNAARPLIINPAQAWWTTTFPGLAILVTVIGFNLLGDALRDALDQRAAALDS
jgi:ABC-type dipeptide/oligopeptide/nickel transport system permease subunit